MDSLFPCQIKYQTNNIFIICQSFLPTHYTPEECYTKNENENTRDEEYGSTQNTVRQM